MTARMIEVSCKCCKQVFMVREADRKRGWGRFCSKSCKAKKQEARTGQHASYLHRQRILTANDGKSARDFQREFGGTPEFDRQGRYIGFRDGGFDNTHHQDRSEVEHG